MFAERVVLRPAELADAGDIARLMRLALDSLDWMPRLHSPDEDLAFIANVVLPEHVVTVAEISGIIAGFIAMKGEWVEQLYLDPAMTGKGMGAHLLSAATKDMPMVRLHCFQQNAGARRFYERHGFLVEALGDASCNEEGLPDVLYIRRQ